MILVSATFGCKKAVLTHIKVEALETAVAKPADGTGFTNVAFGLMSVFHNRRADPAATALTMD